MLPLDEDSPRKEVRTIAIAVVTAALTSLATGLVGWAIDEMKARRQARPSENESEVKP